mmetsp:Transcript_33062/g.93578  ORF Transcript_33062/g.93578 Transcript_33062/m.93578 type:complete len:277 (-) Transcript_33062:236-1066(-)
MVVSATSIVAIRKPSSPPCCPENASRWLRTQFVSTFSGRLSLAGATAVTRGRLQSRHQVVGVRASAAAGSPGAFGDSTGGSTPAEEPSKSLIPSKRGAGHRDAADKFLASLLWNARTFVLAAIAGSLVMSALMIFQGVVGVWQCAAAVVQATVAGTITLESPDVALLCVEVLDKFLCGIVTYIFGTGVFELFIHRIDFSDGAKGDDKEKPSWLHVEGIDDLEMNLGKVVITILVVNLMAAAKKVAITRPQDLTFIGAAVLLAAMALTVLHWADSLH